MGYEVLKPFQTVNRKFAPGEGPGGSLDGTEDVSPHTFDTLESRGFIKSKAAAVMANVPAAAQPKVAATRAAQVPISSE